MYDMKRIKDKSMFFLEVLLKFLIMYSFLLLIADGLNLL